MNRRSVLRGLLLIGVMSALAIGTGCGPTYPECDTDDHCSDRNEFCVDNLCRECREDSHCNATDACKVCGAGYTCVTRPGCCHSDLDCPTGVCRKGAADEVGTCFGNCKGDAQCPAGQKCEANQCVPAAECTGEGQCGPNRECVDGRCVDLCMPEPVYFDYNESKIRLDMKPVIEQGADCIRKRAQAVTVEGHCDERGTDEFNMALGNRRANATVRYLTNLGIPKTTLSTISYGEERPVCSESYESCWRRNRRSEFSFR